MSTLTPQQELNIKYGKNLHVASNNASLKNRDQANNLDPSLQPILSIEPVNWIYDNGSINQYINTNFSYFKFPPRILTEAVEVDDDITIVDIEDKYEAIYKPEPQFVPIIPLFLNDKNEVNFGWNETISNQEFNAIKERDFYNAICWSGEKYLTASAALAKGGDGTGISDTYNYPQIPYKFGVTTRLPAIVKAEQRLTPQARASKYYRAQENAFYELENGISNGRYRESNIEYSPYVDSGSLFEGHFTKIKFTELVNGTPLMQNANFVITQDLIKSKKSLKFDIQLAVSHLDKHGRNRFVIRLVKYSIDSTNREPYRIVKQISSITQGYGNPKNDNTKIKQLKNNLDQALVKETAANIVYNNNLTKYNDQLLVVKKLKENPVGRRQQGGNAGGAGSLQAMEAKQAALSKAAEYKKQLDKMQLTLATYKTNVDNSKKAFDAAIENRKLAEYEYKQALALGGATPLEEYTTEMILAGEYTLWPGRTWFRMEYILPTTAMVLNDTYSIEMLAMTPMSIAHELIEENSYWNITEITNTATKFRLFDPTKDWTVSDIRLSPDIDSVPGSIVVDSTTGGTVVKNPTNIN